MAANDKRTQIRSNSEKRNATDEEDDWDQFRRQNQHDFRS